MQVGTDVLLPMNGTTNLLGRVEATHQFEQHSGNAQGNLSGLFGFDLPGENYKRNWAQVGVGANSHIFGGVGSIMINASTQGEAMTYWTTVNCKWDF